MNGSPELPNVFMSDAARCNAAWGSLQRVKASLDPETRTSRERAEAYLAQIPLCPYIGPDGQPCRMRWHLQPDDNRLARYDADDPTKSGTCKRHDDEEKILPKDVRVRAILQNLEHRGRPWATGLRESFNLPKEE
jgi:hypothetical protein